MQEERNPEQEENVEGFRHKGLQDDDEVEAHRHSRSDIGEEEDDEVEAHVHRSFSQPEDPGRHS